MWQATSTFRSGGGVGWWWRFAAEQRDLAESIAELRHIADGGDHVLAEAAGITAGSWVAWPSTHMGYELLAAGMLIMAAGHDGKPLTMRSWSAECESAMSAKCCVRGRTVCQCVSYRQPGIG